MSSLLQFCCLCMVFLYKLGVSLQYLGQILLRLFEISNGFENGGPMHEVLSQLHWLNIEKILLRLIQSHCEKLQSFLVVLMLGVELCQGEGNRVVGLFLEDFEVHLTCFID